MVNKRISELKNQASVWCDENIPEQFSEETNGYGKAWEDKFAELIVKECIHILMKPEYAMTHNLNDLSLYNEGWVKGRLLGIEHIKHYFGVEQ